MSEQANLMLWLQANNPQALAQYKEHEKRVADQNGDRVMLDKITQNIIRISKQEEELKRAYAEEEKKEQIILRAQKVAEKEKDMRNVDSHTMGTIRDIRKKIQGGGIRKKEKIQGGGIQEKEKKLTRNQNRTIKRNMDFIHQKIKDNKNNKNNLIEAKKGTQRYNIRIDSTIFVSSYENGVLEDKNPRITYDYYTTICKPSQIEAFIQKSLADGLTRSHAMIADSNEHIVDTKQVPYQVSEADMNQHCHNPIQITMGGVPINYKFIQGTDLNDKSKEGFCAVSYIFKTYKEKIPSLTRDYLYEILEIDSIDQLKIKGGVTPIQIQKFCKRYDISHYALNLDKECFLKYVSSNKNYPALIYYSIGNHMYPVVDQATRKSLTEIAKGDTTKLDHTLIALERSKKQEETKAEEINRFTELGSVEDIPIDKLDEY